MSDTSTGSRPARSVSSVQGRRFSDTHPKMEALQIELLRQVSPTRKMEMLAQLNASARVLALNGLRQRNPDASPELLKRKLADLLLGEELALRVYGEYPKNNISQEQEP
jgi:hypothetical protein